MQSLLWAYTSYGIIYNTEGYTVTLFKKQDIKAIMHSFQNEHVLILGGMSI